MGIYENQHKVFMELKALKEEVNSLATHDNLLYIPKDGHEQSTSTIFEHFKSIRSIL